MFCRGSAGAGTILAAPVDFTERLRGMGTKSWSELAGRGWRSQQSIKFKALSSSGKQDIFFCEEVSRGGSER